MASTWDTAQRRPGSRPRRHTGAITCSMRCGTPLNEGRDRDPGDTSCPYQCGARSRALNEGRDRDPGDTRGKAHETGVGRDAQRRPGSRPRRHRMAASVGDRGFRAQRRPGSRPRRHHPSWRKSVRSMRPAQRRPGSRPRRHNRSRRPAPTRSSTLNEGRDRDPGDTRARFCSRR